MKKWIFVLLAAVACIYICTPGYNFTVKGKYASAPDGTVIYITPYLTYDLDSVLVPVDSAVVEDGEFEFRGNAVGAKVCFISSGKIYDGGFFVLEPGNSRVVFNEGVKCSGTENNDELARFMLEKENVMRLGRVVSQAGTGNLPVSPSMGDSIRELVSVASEIFELFAVKLINENIGNGMGHFYLTQSVGAVAPERIVNFFLMVPDSLKDRIYEGKMARVEKELMDAMSSVEYAADAAAVAAETAVGRKYKDFELDTYTGGKACLSGEVAKHGYTLLAFWAGWHDNSCKGVAEASRLLNVYGPKGFRLVTVSLDSSKEEFRSSVSSLGLKGLQLCSPNGGSAEVASVYGVSTLPVYVLINNGGTVISRTSEIADIERKLSEVLEF